MTVDPAKYLAKIEPADARDVIATRKEAKDGDPVVVVGRIGGSKTPVSDERAVFTAVVYVLTSGCAWRHLPPTFGVSPATAHRRFTAWTEAGLWRRLHRAVLDELGRRGELDWTSVIVDAASVRAKRGVL